MKLVWHIVRKDFRRHWIPYLLWVGLLVAKIVICVQALASSEAERVERLQLAYGLTTAIAAVTGFLLAASFALEDELVGARMFWATRPISGLRLLAAKGIGLGLFFVVVPVLVWMPWWLSCCGGGWALWAGAMSVVFVHGLAALTALFTAALTGKSSRLLLLLLTALLLLLVAGLFSAGRYLEAPVVDSDVSLAREIAAAVLIAAGVLGAVWCQYRTRRTVLSTTLVTAGVVLGIWAGRAWPWAFTQSWRGETMSDAGVEAVEVRWVSLTRSTTADKFQLAPGYARFQLRLEVRNVPEWLRLAGGRARISLIWPDGRKVIQNPGLRATESAWVARSMLGVGPDIRSTDEETKAFREKKTADAKAVRAKDRNMPQVDRGDFVELTGDLFVPVELADRLSWQRPECKADVRLGFRRPVPQLEAPLVAGAEAVGGGARVRVLSDGGDRKEKTQTTQDVYSIVHYDAFNESWLNAVLQRSTGVVSVQNKPRTARGLWFVVLAPFSLESVSFDRPRVRRGEAWELAPGANETPTLAVAYYDRTIRAQRQCGLTLPVPGQ